MAFLRTGHKWMSGGFGAAVLLMFTSAPTQAGAVRVGDVLPAVMFADWQGDTVQLAAPRAGVMIIDFWASWCQPCRAALPELSAIGQRYAAAGLQVVTVNVDRTQARADDFLKAYVPAPTMTLLRDPGGAGLAHFGASGLPALYVVDQRGVVRLVESGFTVENLRAIDTFVGGLLSQGGNP